MENNERDYLETKRIMQSLLENKLMTRKEYDSEMGELKDLYKPVFDLISEKIFT